MAMTAVLKLHVCKVSKLGLLKCTCCVAISFQGARSSRLLTQLVLKFLSASHHTEQSVNLIQCVLHTGSFITSFLVLKGEPRQVTPNQNPVSDFSITPKNTQYMYVTSITIPAQRLNDAHYLYTCSE